MYCIYKNIELKLFNFAVVPHAGTWIEITDKLENGFAVASFPTRERGLKFSAGSVSAGLQSVVPHAGTWIEIALKQELQLQSQSFPTREHGLKYWLPGCLTGSSSSFSTRERELKWEGSV